MKYNYYGSLLDGGSGAAMTNMDLLKNLNPEQLEAVLHKDGPLLIVAGAGTGKTTVITRRIAYLIEKNLAKAEEILALTFTEKAASELADRVGSLLPLSYFDLWISTFHSLAERLLKEHGLSLGLPGDFKLLNEFEQWALVKKNLDKFALDYYRPLGNPVKFIRALLKHFSRAKDEDIGPSDYLAYADGLKQDLDQMLAGGKSRNPKSQIPNPKQNSKFKIQNTEIDEQEVARLSEIANAYHVYQQLLLDNNSLDFGDLINYALKLFRERPAILEKYRRQFKYILVDEFQDTNWAQYELIKLLAAPTNNLAVVGDDDQCLPGASLILTERGKKRIDKIKSGEKVATAVGKGYLSYGRVNRVMKNIKSAKLITFITAGGSKITVTDNHKMFGRVLSGWQNRNLIVVQGKKRYYYVYLMYKQELGWRLGMTNDLLTRLKLERSADLLVALKVFSSEAEARYNETLLSLKYGIPTVCFQERDGLMTKKIWSEKLYKDLDVESAARRLAKDLGIDLKAHQVCLAGVNRGGKVRIKINLEMCFRNYRSKSAKGIFLANPKVLHQLTVETSHQPTLRIFKKMGFNLIRAKGGYRLKLASIDLSYLGKLARQIQKAAGGIIENQIKIGTNNIQHKKALIIPAGNLLPGMFLPVVKKNKIIYEQIVERRDWRKKLAVYDLEVDLTHNFVADNIIVHNSIYRFRGASMSNILQFKKDFPAGREIILTKNYRSRQNILDLSYEFIKQNNPHRLEWRLENQKLSVIPAVACPVLRHEEPESRIERAGQVSGLRVGARNDKKEVGILSKKLIAENSGAGEIAVIQGADLAEEVKLAADKIIELKKRDRAASWNDFAVLVRANDSANSFIAEFERRGLPFIFGASRGLYAKPLIMDAVAYFKLLDNYHESLALYRILNLPLFDFTYEEIVNFNHLAGKKAWSLYEVIKNGNVLKFAADLEKKIKPVLALIVKHSLMARDRVASEVLLAFMNDSGYLKYLAGLSERKNIEAISLLNQFLKRIKNFENSSDDKSVKAFLAELNLEIEAGESGSLAPEIEAGPEAIKILTAHGAKGLEFSYVFIANLVDKRFPAIERNEPIQLPDALVKEILPEGDSQLEEERRLFYVAMTRAKQGLYFSWAKDYGGKVKKKPSRFLYEIGLVKKVPLNKGDKGGLKLVEEKDYKSPLPPFAKGGISGKSPLPPFAKGGEIPAHFSYSQLAAYSNCPYQYRFAHILKIPTRGKEQFSFGKTLHSVLQKLFILINEKKELGQGELFGAEKSPLPPFAKGGISGKSPLPPFAKGGISGKSPLSPFPPEPVRTGSGGRRSRAGVKGGNITFEEIIKLYEEGWVDDWFESKQKKQERRRQGLEILKVFYEKHKTGWPEALFLEKGFNFRITDGRESYIIRGVVDRIDRADSGLKLVDYKTGQPKDKLSFSDKEQLLIYQLAIQELFKQEIKVLAFYYLDNNSEVEFIGSAKDLEKIKAKIIDTINKIKRGCFEARPGMICAWCDFKEICQYRA